MEIIVALIRWWLLFTAVTWVILMLSRGLKYLLPCGGATAREQSLGAVLGYGFLLMCCVLLPAMSCASLNFNYVSGCGMFCVVRDATLQNIALKNDSIRPGYVSPKIFLGALAGFTSESTIVNCHARGAFDGFMTVGGLVGYCLRGNILF